MTTQLYRAASHGPSVQTTDGTTVTTIHSIDVSSLFDLHLNECAIYIEGFLLGVDGSNKVSCAQGNRVFKRISGTLSALGTLLLVFPFNGDLVGTPVMTLDASGTIIRLRVVGVAATTITWDGFLTVTTTGF